MTAGLRGDISKLRRLEKSIARLPKVVAAKVAKASASTITAMGRATFHAGENAYGDVWEEGKEGQRVTLVKSGAIARGVRYVATGTKLRAKLGPKYTKYQIWKRGIFPRNGAQLPIAYVEAIRAKAAEVIAAEMKKAG